MMFSDFSFVRTRLIEQKKNYEDFKKSLLNVKDLNLVVIGILLLLFFL
jgi:hypothetical protein